MIAEQAGSENHDIQTFSAKLRESASGLGCVETRGDFLPRTGFMPLRRFLADVDRFSGFPACGRFWRASAHQSGDMSRGWGDFQLNGRVMP